MSNLFPNTQMVAFTVNRWHVNIHIVDRWGHDRYFRASAHPADTGAAGIYFSEVDENGTAIKQRPPHL